MTGFLFNKRQMWEDVGYIPHAGQVPFHEAMADFRFFIASCGRRFGKSQMGGHELAAEALYTYYNQKGLSRFGKRREFWIVGPEYSDAEKEFRVLWHDLEQLGLIDFLDRPGSYNDPINGNMHVSLWDGKFQVHAKSAKYPDTLVGEGLHGVILSEAAKLKPSVWPKYIRPMLTDYRGWGALTSTPEGKNWFYDLWMLGQNPDQPEFWSIRAPSWMNNHLYPLGAADPEVESLRNSMSAEKFNQEIAADFTEFVGRVFKDFEEETHVGNFAYNPRLPLFMATDYGFTNPNVALFIQTDIWDNVTVVGEYYQSHRTAAEFARDLEEDPKLGPLSRAAVALYPDPEDPAASAELSNRFGLSIMGDTGGELNDRLDLIRRWLKIPRELEHLPFGHPERQPKLKVDFSCPHLIDEMGEYRYPETKREGANNPEKPLKEKDHAPEALGRFFGGHYKRKVQPNQRAKVKTARTRR